MRKVNLASFLAQSKHAAEEQRKTLDAARAAGHDVFQDCVTIDYSKLEQRIIERWLAKIDASILRENAAIEYAAAEAGIVTPARRPRTDRPAGVWNQPTEEESDMERDRR